MKEKLYKKENNLFQSPEWLNFQREYGRMVYEEDGFGAIRLELPLSHNAVWIQKAPAKFSEPSIHGLPHKTIFIRFEPEGITDEVIQRLHIRKVTSRSLLSGQASPKATQVLDISKSEEEILAQMKSKTRYNIRLAQKRGVEIDTNANIDDFYQLLLETSGKKTGYFPHEKSYYEKMVETLGPKENVKIFIAKYEGKPLAAILVSFYGAVATYLHGGQSANHRELMAPYLCQWEAIKYAKEKGCTIYDFWGVAETEDPNDPWAGITRFKEGFGGEKVIFAGSYDLVLNKFWYNVLTMGARLKHLIR